jgi:hypothetical protein
MISPGRHHLEVSRDLHENCKQRLAILDLAEHNPKIQAELLRMCAEDILFFINLFVIQFNPNFIDGGSSMEEGPFVAWKYQDSGIILILSWIENRQDGVIEKSRELGASVMCLLICLWMFLFHRNKKFLVISRNADAVDKPDEPDSLFWKLDFVISNLPRWMTKGRVIRRKMGFKNPKLNSYITGQATTGKLGVGGRCTAMFLDEFSQIDEDREVFARTKHTTGCRIFNGTHVGTDTMFYELCDPASAVYSYIQRLQIHWTQHPDKVKGKYEFVEGRLKIWDTNYQYPENYQFVKDGRPSGGFAPGVRSPWYDRMCEGMLSSAIAMDLDIDAHASTALFFDAVLVRRLMSEAKPALWTGLLEYDKDLGKPKSLVDGVDGKLALWINPKLDGVAPFGTYTIAADVSFGTGKTPSCASIFDAKVGRKVGMYVDPWIEPGDFATLCVALSWMFADESGQGALLGWDGHGPCGGQFKNRVVQLGYRIIHYRQMENLLTAKSSDEPGMFYGNAKPKASLLSEYQLALKKRLLVNPDYLSLEECLSFMHDGKGGAVHKKEKSQDDPAGAGENHADRAFADALNWKLARDFAEGGKRAQNAVKTYEPNSLNWIVALQTMRQRQLEEAY